MTTPKSWLARFIDGVRSTLSDLPKSVSATLAALRADPGQTLPLLLVLWIVGGMVLVRWTFAAMDAAVDKVERGAVLLAMLAMTFLAFNEYLQREFQPRFGDMGGLWALEGQMNVALLLMVIVGFVGASLATREGKHITIDALDKILTPGVGRTLRRFTALVAALLSLTFANGAWHGVYEHSQDNFEGAKVWPWMVAPVNLATSLIPGEKFGPRSCFAKEDNVDLLALRPAWCPPSEYSSQSSWEDAQYDKGFEFDTMPPAFGYVQAGDRFPLWLAMLVLVAAFGVMGLRFLARVVVPIETSDAHGVEVNTPPPSPKATRIVGLVGVPVALLALAVGYAVGQGALIIVSSLILVVLGAPLFVGVGVGTLAAWMVLRDGGAPTVIADMFEATKKQELLSIPFFVLAGNLMTQGSIARRLVDFARALVGDVPGGLGAAAVLACAGFAAISGSSPVTVIAMGTILYPMLVSEGYGRPYSMGVLTTAGGLGIIIPPSIPMIVYAIIVSGSKDIDPIDPTVLFKAGILPGMFIASMLILYTFGFVARQRATGVAPPRPVLEGSWFGRLATAFGRAIPALMLPGLILGGIYGLITLRPLGIDFAIQLTVTEAAAIAVVYALFVELFIHRELSLRALPKVFSDSAVMMGSLFVILVIAISLNRFLVFEQIPEAATNFVLSLVAKDNTLGFLIVVNLFLLALGCVMDILSAILIVAPLLAPIAAQYGIDPIHFGIIFIVNLEMGYLTPPLGINLFVASTVFERPILEVMRAVIPFLFLMLFCLAVIVFVPSLSLYLVR